MPPLSAGTHWIDGDSCVGFLPDGDAPGPRVKITPAHSSVSRHSVNLLLERRYGWRGYSVVGLEAHPVSNRITLTATDDSATIGTITVGLDGPQGMSCDDAFGPEIAKLRAEGLRLCEFTKLAVEPVCNTKRVLAALFHVAYLAAYRVRKFDLLQMEVNPRHLRYYQRMLGAKVIGEPRINRSVNAPAVLLSIEFSYIRQQIEKFAGRPELAATERSLYPFAFAEHEEAGIVSRLLSHHVSMPMALN